MIYPVILRSYTSNVAANVPTSNADADGLKNPTNKILRLRELRFHLAYTAAPGNILSRFEFAQTSFQLRIGNTPITAQFVPLTGMVEPIDLSAETNTYASEGLNYVGPHVLRFRQPVLLAPGERITYAVQHSVASALDFRVTAVCDDVESKTGVTPWIAAWTSTARLDGSGDYEESSTESDLVNPFPTSMLVERFIGRLTYENFIMPATQNPGMSILLFDKARVRLDDHHGRQIVRDPTPFGCVFDPIRRGWQVNSTLDARGFYRLALDLKLATQVVTGAAAIVGTNVPGNVRAIVGMLGYHSTRG